MATFTSFGTQVHLSILLLPFCVVSFAIWNLARRRYGSGTHKLPPGPKGIPILGNLLQLSMTPWKEFERWKDEFGPVVYIHAAGQGMLILSSLEAANALLDCRGSIYSDRPRFIVNFEILSEGLSFPSMCYGELYRRMRRGGHEALSKARAVDYLPLQTKEAVTLTDGLLRNPDDIEGQVARTSASTILSVIYDLPQVQTIKDPLVQEVNDFMRTALKASLPGARLVEFFPWMMYIPSAIAKWKREAEEAHLRYKKIITRLYHEVEDRVKQGDERPSFAATLIKEQENFRLSDLENIWLAGILYSGGFETITSTMLWLILAMISYPEKQKKCQEELDAVVGRSRMPTFQDEKNLPYIRATVREILRWRAVLPLGVPHVSKEDGWYNGWFIPKGTFCIAHTAAIHRDRALYGDDADEFNPDRFINENGQLSPPLADTRDGHIGYGFGPRICLGRYMANNALFINIASILWAMNIAPGKDEMGHLIKPNTAETVPGELVIRPLPFKCLITPRFPEAETILAQSKELLL